MTSLEKEAGGSNCPWGGFSMGVEDRKSWMPCCMGVRPVKRVARLAEQMGVQTKLLAKRTPDCASRSMLGVRISLLP